MKPFIHTAVFSFVFLFSLGADSNQAALIVCGSGGQEEYQEKFADWGERLEGVVTSEFGFDEAFVSLLTERPDRPQQISTLMNIEREIQALTTIEPAIERLWVVLIGHGSYFAQTSKFHTPGLDLTATQLNEWLNQISTSQIVIINSSSSSAGFINELSGPGRIICTATKSVDQKNATEFMRFFLEGVESGDADRDFDERITLLEAASRAAELTQAWYDSEQLLATEHSLIDDNGDQLGSRLPIDQTASQNEDGYFAAQCFLKEFSFPTDAPQELIDSYRSVMDEITRLKSKKQDFDKENDYYQQLELLLIQAARFNREIQQYQTSSDSLVD